MLTSLLRISLYCAVSILLFQCKTPSSPITESNNLLDLVCSLESIEGSSEYIHTPYVCAGDRIYIIGAQDGSFPELGWHIQGEMGGIWDHPIKLMDGFTEQIYYQETQSCLVPADRFFNYPFANKHVYPVTSFGLKTQRTQFVPDQKEGILIEYTFENSGETPIRFQFEFNGYTDLRPVWLGERTGMEDGNDSAQFDQKTGAITAKDSLNEWHVIYGSERQPDNYELNPNSCNYTPIGKGCSAALYYSLKLDPGKKETLRFTIAGSYISKAAAIQTYLEIQSDWEKFFQEKKARYVEIAESTKLTTEDKDLETAFRWLKYNTDWLVRDVPEIGRGITAGLPDYPWWFGVDSEYALQGLISCGQRDLVYKTIDLLATISQNTNGNGRIIHEVSTNGAVFNPGNINETPQFASLIWAVYQWTGDREFLEKYFPVIQNGLNWLLSENDADENLLPDGFGMMEIHGLDSEMIDVAVYTQKAFSDAAQIATLLGREETAINYQDKALQIQQKINSDFWVPSQNSYADFIGTTSQALHLIEDAIIRADTLNKPWAVAELKALKKQLQQYPPGQKKGFVVFHNWVVNTPMEMGIADSEKAALALETGRKFTNPFGMFVTGIDRDETAGKDLSSFAARKKIFSYTGAVMTLPTGVQARAENNYGNPDESLDYLNRMTRSFSYALPGSMYEVSPDFGMVCQAWNIYSFAVPIVQQFFGFQPNAYQKLIRIKPQMPTSWNKASLENILIGNNEIDLHYLRDPEQTNLIINGNAQNWNIEFTFPAGKYSSWILNGEAVIPESEDGLEFIRSMEKDIQLDLKE